MLFRLILLKCCLVFCFNSIAKTIVVKNTQELINANKEARPGDIIVLQNGEWNNVTLSLDCNSANKNSFKLLMKPVISSSKEKISYVAFLLTLTDKEFLFNADHSYPKNIFAPG